MSDLVLGRTSPTPAKKWFLREGLKELRVASVGASDWKMVDPEGGYCLRWKY
jgi:hypothetical protein